MTLKLGLPAQLELPRVEVMSEPYPGWWIHHIVARRQEELDAELMDWGREAYAFAESKYRLAYFRTTRECCKSNLKEQETEVVQQSPRFLICGRFHYSG